MKASGFTVGHHQVWARDSMITLLGAHFAQDDQIQAALHGSIALLRQKRSPNGEIPNNVDCATLRPNFRAYADGGQSGVQFHAILARLGIAEAMKPKLRPYPSGGAVEAVARGDADLVVIGVSTIRSVPAVTLVGWLPPELQNYIVFTASISAAARQPRAAQTLLNLLTSSTGIALFKALGFEPMGRW